MATKKPILKWILWSIAILVLLLAGGFFYVYKNLNRLLTESLTKGFNNNIISDVYELKFEDLDVNVLAGNVKVNNVMMNPLEKPAKEYPYINSFYIMQAKSMILKEVDLIKLLRHNKLTLKKIELLEPGIRFTIADSIPVFFPFNEGVVKDTTARGSKKSIESYFLEEFSMKDAYFHVVNKAKVREFDIVKINMSLKDILIDRHAGKDLITYRNFDFAIGELTGKLHGKNLRYIYFKDFTVDIDSLHLEETPDTTIYHFANAETGIKNLDIHTADSIYHITLESYKSSYAKKTIEFKKLSFKPNMSDAAMQKRFKYRKEHIAGEIGSLHITGVNFEALMRKGELFVEEILLDDVDLNIYKDLRKPFQPNKFPEYLGQQIQAIPMPMKVGLVKLTKVNLKNTEVTPDGNKGLANINRASVEIHNLTSQPSDEMLIIVADAWIENKAHTHLQLEFDYNKPEFTMNGKLDKFDLTDLNNLTNSYTPARIKKGIADEITFSGKAYKKYSTGTMTFLYHDLVIDIELEEKAKWKSSVLNFAANTYLNASNPISDNVPARSVKFHVDRDPIKGYLNLVIKSVLDGLKETFLPDKKNRKAYKQEKSEYKKETKAKKKKQ